MENKVNVFNLPEKQIAYPALYAPPLASLPEEDTPESAKIMADRAKYEASLASTKDGRQEYEQTLKDSEKALNLSLEEERAGIDIPETYGKGQPIPGATEERSYTETPVDPPPEEMFSKMDENAQPKEKPATPHVKEVDGRKLLSKKYLDENKEAFSKIANELGFSDPKEFLKKVLN